MIYVDHAAASPLSAAALNAMLPLLREDFGNPSSPHEAGRRAAHALFAARVTMAECLDCSPREVCFTSGGSESDNQALFTMAELGKAAGKNHLVSTAQEHPAVLRALDRLRARGWEVTLVCPDQNGLISPADIGRALRPDTAGVSVMAANNETGVRQPVAEIGALCRKQGVLFHTDAVAAAGRVPLSFSALQADLLSLSGHKFGGPKGTGALLARRGISPVPLILGGGQERGSRAGTENVPAIVGMAAALEQSCSALPASMAETAALRDLLLEGLSALPGVRVTGLDAPRMPGVVHACFEGLESEELLMLLDEGGVCASAGSACSSGALEPSHVLRAMGVPPALARGALRISLGPENTEGEVRVLLDLIARCSARLRRAA